MPAEEKHDISTEKVEGTLSDTVQDGVEDVTRDPAVLESVQRLKEMEQELERESATLKDKIDALLWSVQKSDIALYVEMYRHPVKMFTTNVWMGIGRGIGYLIGFAIGGALLVYLLNQIVEIDLPLIGDFIAEVVRIVQYQLGQPGA